MLKVIEALNVINCCYLILEKVYSFLCKAEELEIDHLNLAELKLGHNFISLSLPLDGPCSLGTPLKDFN